MQDTVQKYICAMLSKDKVSTTKSYNREIILKIPECFDADILAQFLTKRGYLMLLHKDSVDFTTDLVKERLTEV